MQQIYVRPRRRTSAWSGIATFILGFAVGLSVGLYWSGTRSPVEIPIGPEPAEHSPSNAQAPAHPSVVEPVSAPTTAPNGKDHPEKPEATSDSSQAPPHDTSVPSAPSSPTDAQTSAGGKPGFAEDDWPARHLFVAVKGASPDKATEAFLKELKPLGVLLLVDNIKDKDQTAALVSQIKAAVGLGAGRTDLPLVAVDQEGGPLNPLGLKRAPSAESLGRQRDLAAARDIGRSYATACSERGIAIILAPVLDVYEPGAAKTMAARSFGSDQALVAAMGMAFADGVMQGGAIPVAKHYPGGIVRMVRAQGDAASPDDQHGVDATGQPVEIQTVVDKKIDELAKMMFPFQEAVRCRVPGIMVGHIAVPALDKDHPRRPASLSPVLVKDRLRDKWNYGGVLLSENITIAASTSSAPVGKATVEALAAGCDAVCVLGEAALVRSACDAIQRAVEDGTLSRGQLAESKKRLDAWQEWLKKPAGLKGPLPPLPSGREEKPAQVAAAGATGVEPAAPPAETLPAGAPPGTERIEYTVKQGDTLFRIASDHKVAVEDVKKWNGLATERMKVGRKIVLFVPKKAQTKPQTKPEKPKQDEPKKEAAPPAPEPAPEKAAAPDESKPEAASAAGVTEYTIRPGDIPAKIAEKFGITSEQLLDFNGIKDPTKLRAGEKLKIPKG